MDAKEFTSLRKSVKTPYGEIAYVEKGSGPAALFVHGVLLNGYLWRDSLDALSSTRRCIALDLMGHGATKTPADADMSFDAQAAMIGSFLDALGIDQVDLVANDSGGGIAQIFAANNPQRIRTLRAHEQRHARQLPAGGARAAGRRREGRPARRHRQELAREPGGAASTRSASRTSGPEELTGERVQMYLGPLFASEEATRKLERFLASEEDNSPNVRIEPKLRQLQAPTLIMWGTDDVFFDKKWAYWLKDTIPGAPRGDRGGRREDVLPGGAAGVLRGAGAGVLADGGGDEGGVRKPPAISLGWERAGLVHCPDPAEHRWEPRQTARRRGQIDDIDPRASES